MLHHRMEKKIITTQRHKRHENFNKCNSIQINKYLKT